MKKIFALLILFFPWKIRRFIYQKVFGYQIHSTSYIGFSIIFPNELVMGEHTSIGSLNVCKNIKKVQLDSYATIGSLNWITGFPTNLQHTGHFSKEIGRVPSLLMKEHSAITSRHLIDCTNTISIGAFTTIAGAGSQFLTHSINIYEACQESGEITIGKYCFLGTACVVLKGSKIPDFSIVGAMSLMNKQFEETHCVYGGVPAKKLKKIEEYCAYFDRREGYIV